MQAPAPVPIVSVVRPLCGLPCAHSAGVRGAGRVQQEFEGWGTSLAWFANIIGRFADPLRSHLADLLFDVQARAVKQRWRARCRANLRMPRARPVRWACCAACALVPRHPAGALRAPHALC